MAQSKLEYITEGVAGASIMAVSLITPFLNDRRRKWGTMNKEVQQNYPGDDLVPNPRGEYMHTVTINAPAAEVWKWLVQIGQGRGGFYSYELLENIIGCKIHNAETIMPELQKLKVGDSIPMHPSMGSPYKVAVIEPDSTLILELRVDVQTGETFESGDELPEKYQNQSWLFLLTERDDGTTWLISRSRNDWNKSAGNTVFYGIFGPLTMEMDRKMLLGIKKRAEAGIRTSS
ncbi:hypothetical protein ACFLYQ_07100 [Chloroflexota bacterium]